MFSDKLLEFSHMYHLLIPVILLALSLVAHSNEAAI